MKNKFTMALLIAGIALIFAGTIWGNVVYYIEGWDKALSLKEKWDIWFMPFVTCILPGLVFYGWFKFREK